MHSKIVPIDFGHRWSSLEAGRSGIVLVWKGTFKWGMYEMTALKFSWQINHSNPMQLLSGKQLFYARNSNHLISIFGVIKKNSAKKRNRSFGFRSPPKDVRWMGALWQWYNFIIWVAGMQLDSVPTFTQNLIKQRIFSCSNCDKGIKQGRPLTPGLKQLVHPLTKTHSFNELTASQWLDALIWTVKWLRRTMKVLNFITHWNISFPEQWNHLY